MDDLISRQAAIDCVMECYDNDELFEVYEDRLNELPPVQPELIYCKDCKKQNKDYHMSPYKDTVCPLTAWRGTAQGHEYDYQFCCFAERRDVTT